MYEKLSRRKFSNVKDIHDFCIFYLLFVSIRKNEIERLRKDLAHMQRSSAAPPTVKPTTHENNDPVCLDLFQINFYYHIIFLSTE
jgi:hypothetical protein